MKITATVIAVVVSYFSEGSQSRITTDKGEILIRGVAPFRKGDVITAEGKDAKLNELDQHARDLLADISPDKSVFQAKEISHDAAGVTLRDLAL